MRLNLATTGTFFDSIRFILSILLAIAIAKLIQRKEFSAFLKRGFNVKAYPFGRLWNEFLKVDHNIAVRVFLKDGSAYVGQLGKVSQDPDDNVQEIELLNPYQYHNSKGGKGTVNKIKETTSMLIGTGAVSGIEKISDEEGKKLYDF